MKIKYSQKKLSRVEIKKNIIEYSNEALNMEFKREENILNKCNSTINTLSILIIVAVTVIFELYKINIHKTLIAIFGLILIIFLLLSLLFCLIAQWFFKRKYMNTIDNFINHVNDNFDLFKNEELFLNQKIKNTKDIYNSLRINNNKRIKYNMLSNIMLFIFFGLTCIFIITMLIIEV